jgi:hypothetical protein
MNQKISLNKFKGISLVIFLLVSIIIVPINFGYADSVPSPDGNAVYDTEISYQGAMTSSARTIENVENTCGTPVNVKDSLIMSIVTLCIPGILEKVKEWNEISCEAVVCKYNAIEGDVDPSFCEKQKEYKFCKYIWGELFSIPPLTIIEMYKDILKELVANPVGILYSYAAKMARIELGVMCQSKGDSCTGMTVGLTAGFLFIVDITGVIQTFEDMMENGFDGNKNQQNFCEQARDIKKKMELIITEYNNAKNLGGSQ